MKQLHARRRAMVLLVVAALLVGLFALPAVAYGDDDRDDDHGGDHGGGKDRGHKSITFTDVPGNDWAWGYISAMGARGILAGYGDGRFGPKNHVTKLELVILVTRLLGAEDEALAQKPEDVIKLLANAMKDWRHIPTWTGAREDLAYALDQGYLWPLMQGPSHNFQPGTPATRVEVVVVLLEAMGLGDQARDLAGSAIDFRDAADVPLWARGYVALAISLGILQGDGGKLQPNKPVTRAEMAALLARADEDFPSDADRSVVGGTVTAIHVGTSTTDPSTITIRHRSLFGGIASGTTTTGTATYELAPNAVVMVHDAPASLSAVAVGDRVALYLDEDGKVLLIDAEDEQAPAPTTTVGTLTAWTVDSSGKLTALTLRPITTGSHTPTPVTYTVAADATLTKNGHTQPVSALAVGLSLRLGLTAGVVKTIEIIGQGDDLTDEIVGTISRVTVGTGSVASAVGIIPTGGTASDERILQFASSSVVVVNDAVSTLANVQPGDHAAAHLNAAGRITLLDVEYAVTQADGTVTGIVRDAQSHLTAVTLVKDSHATTYSVAADVAVTHDSAVVADTLVTVGDQLAVTIARGSITAIVITVDVP